MKYVDYREKLGLGFSDEERCKMFLGKAYIALREEMQLESYIEEESYGKFCYLAGIKGKTNIYQEYSDDFQLIAKTLMEHTDNINDFIYYYSIYINSTPNNSYKENSIQTKINCFIKWAEESGLQFDFYKDDDGYFIFPKGAKELDDALVSEPLEWLSAYPKTRKAYIDALKSYSNATKDNASQVADNFRKALERFFQEFFSSTKSIENLKNVYGDYLKKNHVPTEISSNVVKILGLYTTFINNNAKHHDKTNKNILEYMMYETGNIMRLLITLKQEENRDAN